MNKIDGINAAGAAAGNLQIGGSAAAASPAELNSWYEAMAKAWGSALDDQAGRIASMSGQISEAGSDQPSTMTVLTAESMRMQFMSQNASTSMTSIGQALESLGRKQ
jgi:hypothetical protein